MELNTVNVEMCKCGTTATLSAMIEAPDCHLVAKSLTISVPEELNQAAKSVFGL